MKIVAISDSHNRYEQLTIPECDLLISCGDYSMNGHLWEVIRFHKWLNKQPAKHIISVQGNHEQGVEKDFSLSKNTALEECPRVHFIDEGYVEIEGIKIWCSAITPFFCNWAWNRRRGEEIKSHWDKIPLDIDILVTHGPPYMIGDMIRHEHFDENGVSSWIEQFVGCVDLSNKIKELTNLRLHFFGHVHPGYGHTHKNGVDYYNCSVVNHKYQIWHPPTVVEFEK